MPWTGSIAVGFWLKERHHETEQHSSVNMGNPCLSAQEYLATHQGCPCPVVLMEWSLPSYPNHVTVLLAVRAWWVWVVEIFPVLESTGSSSSKMTSQGESSQGCTVVWSNRHVILAEREEAPNRVASLCQDGQPLPLCPGVSSGSPRLSLSHRPHGAVTALLARAGHRPACC